MPISHDAAEGEISYRLEDASCRTVFTSAARKSLVAKLSADRSGSETIVIAGEGAEPVDVTLEQLASDASGEPLDPSNIDRASFILYTSGTTGRAKGVLLSVRRMLWIAAACWAPICGLSERDVVLSPLPLFHSAQSLCAWCARHGRERAHHDEIFAAADPGVVADGQVLPVSGRADDVSLHHAAG